MEWLEVYENHFISLGKGNSLCRCAVCDKLDNQCTPAYLKENKLGHKDVLRFKAQKLSHLAQMQQQRQYFDAHKDKAMQQPLEEWCITFDGMDQAKTQLPSRARFSKDLDAMERIKLHWIGVFCFGGPQPVMGLMNTPELRKDAALSVVTLMRILECQWLALVKQYEAGMRATNSQAASQAASQAGDRGELRIEEHGDASTLDSGAAVYSGPGMKWPRRLHVTFDNASSECKNQWMMRFLGLLVFHGIFEAITASMLLVGHTHDIVDQMFSVWSRMLRIHNAETYEKMRDLFRDRYHSRIDGLVDLMRGNQEAFDALTPEEQKAYNEEIMEAGAEWNDEQADILADFSAFVKKHDYLSPHIEHQTVTVDIEGWLRKAVKAKNPPSLKGIPKAYNFGVEKDKDGNVYLYNSQFANSAELQTGPAVHSYPNQITGNWTTRALLYMASDPGLTSDPYRMPPLKLELGQLHITAAKYKAASAMTAPDHDDFTAMLNRLQIEQEKQRADCEECYKALTSFGDHGVVSQRKKASSEEKKQANKKLTARGKSWTAMQRHIRDPSFADVHQAKMVHTGFWTNWLERFREHIQPAYIERAIIFNPDDLAQPFHPAETELCSGVGEPPVHSDRAARIDLIYLHQQGTPVEGQVAIQRTAVSREPFYVCKIMAVKPSGNALRRLRVPADEAEATAEPASAQSARPAERPVAEEPEGERMRAPRLKDLDFQVRYYDLCPDDFEKLHLSSGDDNSRKTAADTKWWMGRFSERDQKEEELTAAMEYATNNRKPAPARPSWLVNLYHGASFLLDEKTPISNDWISGATLVAWGAGSHLLKSAARSHGHPTWQLREPVWRQLQEDLTEHKSDAVAMDAIPGSNAKARAGSSKRKKRSHSQEDDDSDEASAGMPEHSGGAAAAAATPASTRPRLPRSAHAAAPVVDDEEEEEEEQEEEEAEEEAASDWEADNADFDMEDHAPLDTFPQANANKSVKESSNQKENTNKPAAAAAAAAAATPGPRRRRQKQKTGASTSGKKGK